MAQEPETPNYDYSYSYKRNAPKPSTLEKILQEALKEKSRSKLADQMLDATQLYFDSLIYSKKTSDAVKSTEKRALETLLSINEKLVSTDLNETHTDLRNIKQEIKDIYDELKNRKITEIPSGRYLDETLVEQKPTFMKAFYKLAEETLKGVKIDTIVYIASGGLEASLLVKKVKPNAELVPIRYSHYKRGDEYPITPRYISKSDFDTKIRGKNVIVIDDDIDSAESMVKVLKKVLKFNPAKLYCGAPLGKEPEDYDGHPEFKKYVKTIISIRIEEKDSGSNSEDRGPSFYIAKEK